MNLRLRSGHDRGISFSYMIIIPYRIGLRNFMGLNTKLETLLISLKFWVRMVLGFVFRSIIFPVWPDVSP